MRRFPRLLARVDLVALLDEWAARFFEELDYVREGQNATKFAEQMKEDLPQVRGRRASGRLRNGGGLSCGVCGMLGSRSKNACGFVNDVRGVSSRLADATCAAMRSAGSRTVSEVGCQPVPAALAFGY